jgi:carbon monoxide dehydrogenase subunit G
MIKVEGNIEINRPIEQVWKFLTSVENASKWDTGIVEARQTSDGPVGLGTIIEAVRESRSKRRTMKVEVTEYDLNKRVAWTIGDAGYATGRSIYNFESSDRGTRLSKTSEIELKSFCILLTPILRRRFTNDEIVLDLNNIKRYVEAAA